MRIILFVLCIGLSCSMPAQGNASLEGKVFPYAGRLQFNGKDLSLRAFQGKPVILELFSSSCVVCFRMMPEVNALQKAFKGKLQFLLVGYRDDKIEKLYDKFRKQLGLELETAFSSTLFESFRPEAFPCYVWIRKDGTVSAVTYGDEEMTRENISSFLATGEVAVKEEKPAIYFDYMKPLYLSGNGGEVNDYLVYSALSRWNSSEPYFMMLDLAYYPGTQHFNALGISLDRLYKYAVWGRSHWEYGHRYYGKKWPFVIIERKFPSSSADSIARDAYFSFTAAYQGTRAPDLQQLLRNELDAYFGYSVDVETRLMPCYVVTLAKPGLFRSETASAHSEMDHAGFTLNHASFNNVLSYLDYYSRDTIPFIDETGIDYRVDLQVDALLTEQASFFEALQKKGIIVTKTERPMEVIVLRAAP